jgi:hypothetical protein
VGDTVCDPFNGTVVPFKSAVVAFCVLHVKVELPPDAIKLGPAVIPAAGGPPEPTVTVACAVAVAPDELVAMNVYVVVDVGETVCDPLTATAAPFKVALAAFVDVQVSVELPPAVMEVGLAVMPAVGAAGATVTVVCAVAAAPDELVAMNVYVVVDVGETVCDPLMATAAPFKVALAAFVDVQVRVELPPAAMEVGLAVMPAVGPEEPTVTVACDEAVAPDELVATNVYVVVDVGDTTCDPFTATAAPFRVALAAFVEVQVRVELPPAAMEFGLAVMPAVGAEGPTVTVACDEAVAPDELVETNV